MPFRRLHCHCRIPGPRSKAVRSKRHSLQHDMGVGAPLWSHCKGRGMDWRQSAWIQVGQHRIVGRGVFSVAHAHPPPACRAGGPQHSCFPVGQRPYLLARLWRGGLSLVSSPWPSHTPSGLIQAVKVRGIGPGTRPTGRLSVCTWKPVVQYLELTGSRPPAPDCWRTRTGSVVTDVS